MMESPAQKKIAAIHDISCFGRCSLTVALPILSAAGHYCQIVPTAVLSAHTGFAGFHMLDTSEIILKTARHWMRLGLSLDAIYTGFLASAAQVDTIIEFVKMFNPPVVLVDPVMGDEGELYPGFGADYPQAMARLVGLATHICPNITEAALLADADYIRGLHSEEYLADLLAGLQGICTKDARIVITGVLPDCETIGVAVGGFTNTRIIRRNRIQGQYPGTGDIFASVLLCGILRGDDILKCVQDAADFVTSGIKRGRNSHIPPLHGIPFELELGRLVSDQARS